MNLLIKNIIRFLLILAVQLVVLNNIPPLHQFIVPYFYYVFILWLPFRITRTALLFVAFAVGYWVDIFYKTPGLHLAASLLIAYLRPAFIQLLMPKEATEWGNEEPSIKTMGQVPYITYIIIMTLVHHFYLILLEWLQFGSFLYFTGKLIGTTVVSLLLVTIADLLLNRNLRKR
jgi:hypothetical protein